MPIATVRDLIAMVCKTNDRRWQQTPFRGVEGKPLDSAMALGLCHHPQLASRPS